MRKNGLYFVIASILVFSVLGCNMINKTALNDAQGTLEEARRLYANKQYSSALEKYKQVINENPTSIDAYLDAMDIYILKKNYDDALVIANNGESVVTEKDKLLFKKGQVYLSKGDDQEAQNTFEKAYKENEQNLENVFALVHLTAESGDVSQAKSLLEKITTSESSFHSKQYLTLALLSYEDTNKAVDYLTKARENLHPDYEDIVDSFEKALENIKEQQGDQVYTNTILAYHLISNDMPNTAIALLEQAIQLNDENWSAYMYLGICNIQIKEYNKAIDEFLNAISIEPGKANLHHLLAQAYTWENNQQEAINSFENAIEVDPEDEKIQIDYARGLYKFGLYSQAEVVYKNLIKTGTSNYAQYQLELAEMYVYKQSKFDDAQVIAKTLIEQWEGFSDAENTLKARIYDIYGWTLEQKNQRDDARTNIERALELDGTLSSAHYHLGSVLLQIEQFNDAKIHLERAIDLDLEGNITPLSKKELDKI